MSSFYSYDKLFGLAAFLLLISGFFILASASMGISVVKFGKPYYYLLHQFAYGLIPGLILFAITLKIHYVFWRRHVLWILLLAIFLMFLVFVPSVGIHHAGARRWIALGSISFQPAEFLKFAYVVYLAAWIESKSKAISSFKFGLLPFSIMSAFIASFLILQPDIGTLGVLLGSALMIFFISGGGFKQIAMLALVGIMVLGILIWAEPYRLSRVKVFLEPAHDSAGMGYQVNQALIAAGSGGFWGRGFGLSRQKFSYLPEAIGDSIFAVAAEELGFIGSTILIAIFLMFFLRGIWLAEQSPDIFGKVLGAGILFLIIFQALVNISAIIGVLPLTGIPLPFVSYGGSALAIALAEVGIILNISKYRI